MRLTLEALFGPTPLAGPTPAQVKLSPDGRFASFLRPAAGDRERHELWLMDLRRGTAKTLSPDLAAAAAGEMTAEEQAERERRRSFAGGITSHQWHADGEQVLIVAHGSAFIARIADDSVYAATPAGSRQTGIRLSPRGTYLSYVRDGDLVISALEDGPERRLTTDGGGTVSNGLPEFIAQEEMHRFDGHWWSPDERMLAFTRVIAHRLRSATATRCSPGRST